MAIITFIITITILVFVHEYGHYYAAKTFGIKVEEFSIGFGKELFARIDKNGVRWKICLIPLGGFVKMDGFNDQASEDKNDVLSDNKKFASKPLYARFLVVAAGPIANFLLALVLFTFLYANIGKIHVPAIIGTVLPNSPASYAGLIPGDKITKVNSESVEDFQAVQKHVMLNTNSTINFEIERDGIVINKTISQALHSSDTNSSKARYIGITVLESAIEYNHYNVFQATYEAIKTCYDTSTLILKLIGQAVTGNLPLSELNGPISIASQSKQSLEYGISNFLYFLAILSVNLGLINLLPIPTLDGGYLVLQIYELIIRKPLRGITQNILLKIGTLIIIFLIVISLINDIKNLIFYK